LLLLFVAIVGWLAVPLLLYHVIDQAVSLNHMQVGYRDTEKNLKNLARFTVDQSPKLTRTKVLETLRQMHPADQIEEEGSIIHVDGLGFEFSNDGMLKRVYQWGKE